MSKLEDDFHSAWNIIAPDLLLEREFSDIPCWESDYERRYAKSKRSKRYRADFAHPDARVTIEIQGGTWNRGRHVQATGYARDARKFNLVQLSGWQVFLLVTETATDHEVLYEIASHIRNRLLRA
jgi:very-short-patch-repair endonuclease